jgi:hypothetical protein
MLQEVYCSEGCLSGIFHREVLDNLWLYILSDSKNLEDMD